MAKKRNPSRKKKAPVKNKVIKTIPVVEPKVNFWKEYYVPVIFLFILPFILYGKSLGFEYVLDDQMVITGNNFVKKGFGGIWEIMTTESFLGYLGEQKNILIGGRYRPLSIATFAIEYQFFGLNPWVGHFNNILLYSFSGLLLFRVLLLMMPVLKSNKRFLSLPFIASLLFVLHPIHVEVVANIKGRDEILALFLCLTSLYLSLKYVKTENIFLLFGACVSLFLGILSKENGITWLAIIPMSLYFFTKSNWNKIGKVALAIFITTLLYLILRRYSIGHWISTGEESQDIMNNPWFGLGFGEKMATVIYTLGMYIKLLIFPHPLTHDYYPYQIPILTFLDWKAILSLLANLGLLVYALFGIRKKTIASYSILFYFITLSIVSNIVINIGTTMNDRFIYMSSLGFCILLGYFISRWMPAKLNEKSGEINILAVGLLMFLVVGYAAKTYTRVPDWRNAKTLNTAAIKYSPNSARANCFMGVALFEEYKIETDRERKNILLDDITYYINKALEIHPAYSSALTMKSGVAAEQFKRDFDFDKMLQAFTEVLGYMETTEYTDTYIRYLIDENRQLDKVLPFLYNIGFNVNLQQRRSYNTALHYLNFAYEINPRDEKVVQAMATCYQALGNQAKANELLRTIN